MTTSNGNMTFTVKLAGRFWALLSVLPLFIFGFFLFCILTMLASSLILKDALLAFETLLFPLVMGAIFLLVMMIGALFILRWHGQKTLEILETGLLFTRGKSEPIYLKWADLNQIELRYASPNLIHCTLRSAFWEFGFSNLDLNLIARVPFNMVFDEGFRVDRIRQFLFLIKKMAPQIEWRAAKSFQDRFKIFYPPEGLERIV